MTIAFKRNLIWLETGPGVRSTGGRLVRTLRRGTVLSKHARTGHDRHGVEAESFWIGRDTGGRRYLIWAVAVNGSGHTYACQPLDSRYLFEAVPVEENATPEPPENSTHLLDQSTGTRN